MRKYKLKPSSEGMCLSEMTMNLIRSSTPTIELEVHDALYGVTTKRKFWDLVFVLEQHKGRERYFVDAVTGTCYDITGKCMTSLVRQVIVPDEMKVAA